jgi:putative spermidine/putrescine transport system ATP-binding protein
VREQLRDEIRRIQLELGVTTVFVTHDQEEALSMADRVGVMRAGRLEQCDVPGVLYDRPATPFVAEFVGTMNHIPGRTEEGGRVRVLGQVLPSDAEGAVPPAGTEVDVLVRPEAVVVQPAAQGDAVVMVSTFRGSSVRIRLAMRDGSELLADVASHRAAELATGTQVAISLLDRPVLLAT